MKLSPEAQAWLAAKVQDVMSKHHLGEPERAGVYYELMSHLHAAGEGKATDEGRIEVTVGDLQAAMLDMGGEAALVQAFVAPRAKPLKRAGVIVRTGALVIDYIVIALGFLAIHFFLFMTGLFLGPLTGFRLAPWDSSAFDPFSSHWGGPGLVFPLIVLLTLAYFTFFEGREGRSLGKKVFNLRVLRQDGAPPALREAAIRNLVKVFPPFLLLDVLFMLVFFYDAKQRVSDRIAETIVVEAD